jgi:hypothetical protein
VVYWPRKIGKKGFFLNVLEFRRTVSVPGVEFDPFRAVTSVNSSSKSRIFDLSYRMSEEDAEKCRKQVSFGLFFWRYLCSFKGVWNWHETT